MRQVRGQEVHWYLILNQLFFKIYEILLDYDKQNSWHELTVVNAHLRNLFGHIFSLILMRQVRALEVHWYLIINQAFFLSIREILDLGLRH